MAGVDSLNKVQENRVKYAKYFTNESNDSMSMDTFYKLLSAEMSNQDPMEPMSNTEFISQMASFTSLQTQKDALYYSNANYAQSLVGKTVTVAVASGSDIISDSGIVTSMNLTNGEFKVNVNGKSYSLANVMEVVTNKNPYEANGSDIAYAASLIGKNVTLKDNTSGSQGIEWGTVQRVEIKDAQVMLIVGDLAYPLSSVVKIENAAEAANNDKDDKSDDDKNNDVDETGDTNETDKTNDTKKSDETNEAGKSETSSSDTEYNSNQPDEPDLVDDSDELKELFG